jgi:hypothetical protein
MTPSFIYTHIVCFYKSDTHNTHTNTHAHTHSHTHGRYFFWSHNLILARKEKREKRGPGLLTLRERE